VFFFAPGLTQVSPISNRSKTVERLVRSGGRQSRAMFTLLNSPGAGAGCISHPEQVCRGIRHRHARQFLLIRYIRLINDYHICQIKSKSKICAYNTTPLHKNQSDCRHCMEGVSTTKTGSCRSFSTFTRLQNS